MHVSPLTVSYVQNLGHDIVRVNDVLPPSAHDEAIIDSALAPERADLTQDLDFSALTALSGRRRPSIITLRLSTARVESVNETLKRALPLLETPVEQGSLITVGDNTIRVRLLPLS
jgi:predicted nuclease of predicted toxin-antitoxin system